MFNIEQCGTVMLPSLPHSRKALSAAFQSSSDERYGFFNTLSNRVRGGVIIVSRRLKRHVAPRLQRFVVLGAEAFGAADQSDFAEGACSRFETCRPTGAFGAS